MPLEATMILLDNSEWARSGDYGSNRWESMQDAANLLCEAKMQQHQESGVGVLSLAGVRPELLLTPTSEVMQLNAIIFGIKISKLENHSDGQADFMTGIQIAQLALKHRANKTQRQRIVVFVASPVQDPLEKLQDLGKKLKKNNVALDVVNISDHYENLEKLEALVNAANNNENSHILSIEPGTVLVSDALLGSPILQPEGEVGVPSAPAAAGQGGGSGGMEDMMANLAQLEQTDPELAMALRISIEEQRDREERKAKAQEDEPAPAQPPAPGSQPLFQEVVPQQGPALDVEMDEQDDEDDNELEPEYDLDEEEMLAQALKMSEGQFNQNETQQPAQEMTQKEKEQKQEEINKLFEDENFMKDVLAGVDIDEEEIGEVLKKEGQLDKKDEKKDDKKD